MPVSYSFQNNIYVRQKIDAFAEKNMMIHWLNTARQSRRYKDLLVWRKSGKVVFDK